MSFPEELIRRFDLQPLPGEGGWFARTWTGPEGADGRPHGTCILYLITRDEPSRPHRLPSDEIWHFHSGDAVELVALDPRRSGAGRRWRLGPAVLAGDLPQAVVPAGWWQAARLVLGGAWALLGCSLAPGWEATEWEAGDPVALAAAYPEFGDTWAGAAAAASLAAGRSEEAAR
jgi:predicted cupin superfamily sugar epimerase